MTARAPRVTDGILAGIPTGTVLVVALALVAIVDLSTALFAAVLLVALLCLYVANHSRLFAFSLVIWVFVLAYSRLALPLTNLEGWGNRGDLALGDLLWLMLVLGWAWARTLDPREISIATDWPKAMWYLLPFLLTATLLPFVGAAVQGWPISFALPGLRQLQWASFAFLTFVLARQYGTSRIFTRLTAILSVAIVLHCLYALLQGAVHSQLLAEKWLFLDIYFARHHAHDWFDSPRLTALLTNPNGYGLMGALTLVPLIAQTLTLTQGGRLWWWVATGSCLFAVAASSSRSALLGLLTALAFMAAICITDRKLARRLLMGIVGAAAFMAITIPVAWPLLGSHVLERFGNLLTALTEGASADITTSIRLQEWERLWSIYITHYPFGTWAPPSYTLHASIDSFYMVTALQGTPLFTIAWIVAMGAALLMGCNLCRSPTDLTASAIGLTLAGWTGLMLTTGLTLSAMLIPPAIVLYWSLVGLVVAELVMRQRERHVLAATGSPLPEGTR